MRAISSAASLTVHIALGAAVVLGSTKARQSTPAQAREVTIIIAPTTGPARQAGEWIAMPRVSGALNVPVIALPSTLLPSSVLHPTFSDQPGNAPARRGGSAAPVLWTGWWSEERPEVLTGPVPRYPEWLRQAGVQGSVLLEAEVDTTGRIQPGSVLVISTTHPDFVAPARQALLGTLFRPARVGGRAVRMRVRIPFEFTIRD